MLSTQPPSNSVNLSATPNSGSLRLPPPGAPLNICPSPPAPSASAPQLPQPMSVQKCRARHFHRKYAELCRRRNVQPLPELRERTKAVLDFHCDRVRLDDWSLILQALAGDDALVALGVRSRKACTHVLETVDNEKKCRALRTQPPFCAKFIFQPLIEVIATRLTTSTVLNTLLLEGLPLTGRYVQHISKALLQNSSLRYVSFARSNLADDGCEQLCTTLKHLPNVDRINLSGCYLGDRGAASVSALLKYQKIIRFSEGWHQSLRYRDVQADQIPGLKYVALNQNPDIGDAGLHGLLTVLAEDEWIRGMEMQSCGITDKGAQAIVECLNVNKALLVFDVRNNAGITVQSMNHIRQQLGIEVELVEDGGTDGSGVLGAPMAKMTTKAKMAQSKDRIACLEQQLALEVEQRKHAEALNEKLHQQLIEAQASQAAKEESVNSDEKAATNVMSQPDFTLVSKEHLHSLLLEVSEHHPDRLCASQSSALLTQTTNPNRSSKSTIGYSSSSGNRSVRKAKSEQRAGRSGEPSKVSKSECQIRNMDRPKSPQITFVERRIGDYTNLVQQASDVALKPEKHPRNTNIRKRAPKSMMTPSSFFTSAAIEESDGVDSDEEELGVGQTFNGMNRAGDFMAHGDC